MTDAVSSKQYTFVRLAEELGPRSYMMREVDANMTFTGLSFFAAAVFVGWIAIILLKELPNFDRGMRGIVLFCGCAAALPTISYVYLSYKYHEMQTKPLTEKEIGRYREIEEQRRGHFQIEMANLQPSK